LKFFLVATTTTTTRVFGFRRKGENMNAKKFLEQAAKKHGLWLVSKAIDGDIDLVPNRLETPSAKDLISLCAVLVEEGYSLHFMKDEGVVHVHAPHRKEHNWGDRGWGCTHGLEVRQCEVMRGPSTLDQKLRMGLRGRQLTQGR
jgi:hypothetical protein